MALGRHYRAEREFRADDRRKRYGIDDQELVLEMASAIPGDPLDAINTAVAQARYLRNVNDGQTPVADATDAILERRHEAGFNSDGTVRA